MSRERAHTYVDAGNARAATPWSARCWSAFLGNTVSLVDRVTGREWLARPSAEVGLAVDGEPLSLMDFRGGDWAEECNPHGASLVCRLTADAVTLFTRCTAMHESPGLLRETGLMNRAPRPLTVSEVVLDTLPLDLPSGRRDLFRRVSDAAVAAGDDAGALLLGHGAGVAVTVEADEDTAAVVTLRCRDESELAPGQLLRLPDTWAMPFTGSFETASGREYAAFLRGVRDLRAWREETGAAG